MLAQPPAPVRHMTITAGPRRRNWVLPGSGNDLRLIAVSEGGRPFKFSEREHDADGPGIYEYGGGIELLFAQVLAPEGYPVKYFVAAASITAYTRVTITYSIR